MSLVALSACGGAQPIPDGATSTVLSLKGLDCSDCGDELAKHMREKSDVYGASFDKHRSEVTVIAAPKVDVLLAAKALAQGEEYELVAGAGHGSYLPWAAVPEGADIATIAEDGADVIDLAPHLVRGKITLVDFSAKWCDPCRKLDEHVVTTLAKRSDIAYRKADIGDWDTPLAKRWLVGIASLPYVLVYDRDGKKLGDVVGLDIAKLDAVIAKGAK